MQLKDLPLELRVEVYRQMMNNAIDQHFQTTVISLWELGRSAPWMSLLHVSKEFRLECLRIFWGETKFAVYTVFPSERSSQSQALWSNTVLDLDFGKDQGRRRAHYRHQRYAPLQSSVQPYLPPPLQRLYRPEFVRNISVKFRGRRMAVSDLVPLFVEIFEVLSVFTAEHFVNIDSIDVDNIYGSLIDGQSYQYRTKLSTNIDSGTPLASLGDALRQRRVYCNKLRFSTLADPAILTIMQRDASVRLTGKQQMQLYRAGNEDGS